MYEGGIGADGRALWDIHYVEIVWFCLLLDLYLFGDCLGDQISNRILIGRSWWIPDWCFFPISLGSPLVREIWRSIYRELFLSLLIRILIGKSWDWPGYLEFSRDINQEIIRATGSLIGRPWRRRVWFGWSRLGFIFWGIFWSGDPSGDRDFDWDIRSSIDQGFSGISTCWEISWDLDQTILLASPLGCDRDIVAIQIDTTVEYCSPIYKNLTNVVYILWGEIWTSLLFSLKLHVFGL